MIASVIILLILSLVMLVIALFQLREKGCLLNNAYLYATARERETMNKKPYYRQSAIAFGLLGVMFLLMAGATFWRSGWLWAAGSATAVGAVIYAVASSIRIEKARPD